ncbi:MAG: hypothetical protein Q7T59_04910 [Candidatus Woesebacteria bacterium]|jgi:hypothetical protein|nr:hypothetical protein [Candidatus Woesebacteria bacterium]
MATRRPESRMKFKKLPIPKYLNIKKIDKRIEISKPRLLFPKIKENVKRQERKKTKKKRGRINRELGLKK